MKSAVIDLGTSTFNLLIAEVEQSLLRPIYETKEAVLLGMGGINDGVLAEEAINRAMNTLERFNEIANSHGILSTDIKAIGTSALRVASNAEKFLITVKERFGISIEIISGAEEAQLIYQGVKWTYNFDSPAVIMDVGGGSTEFIHAHREGVTEMGSFEIGVSRIFQHLNKPTVYNSKDIQSVYNFMNSEEQGRLGDFVCNVMIGSSGSFETFYEMINQKEFKPGNNVVELNLTELQHQLDWSISSSLEDRMNNPWIIPIRKKMLPIAAVQIKWALDKLGTKRVLLSAYSLKEGGMG